MALSSAGTSRPGPPSLRPLSIGELFDRATSIYFRHLLTFAAILLVIVAPFALLQFLQLGFSRDLLDAYLNIFDSALKHPSTPPDMTKLDAAMKAQTPLMEIESLALTGISYLFAFFAFPLANAAVVSGVSRAYLGLPVRFKLCYQDAFSRWAYALLLTLLWLIVAGFAIAIVFGGMLLSVLFIALLGAALSTAGYIIGSLIAIAIALVVSGLLIMGYMAFASSFIACVLEKVDPLNAFVLGVTRIFGGGLFGRSLFVALAIALVFIGVSLVAAFIDLLVLYFTKNWFLYFAIAQALNVLYVAFAFVLVSVYYYDIRIRREGFDLQVLADQISAPAS